MNIVPSHNPRLMIKELDRLDQFLVVEPFRLNSSRFYLVRTKRQLEKLWGDFGWSGDSDWIDRSQKLPFAIVDLHGATTKPMGYKCLTSILEKDPYKNDPFFAVTVARAIEDWPETSVFKKYGTVGLVHDQYRYWPKNEPQDVPVEFREKGK